MCDSEAAAWVKLNLGSSNRSGVDSRELIKLQRKRVTCFMLWPPPLLLLVHL